MISRRGFIRAGAATVGSLALRPFGLLPAMAQSSANYRALVCVFLFGGNDSNNTVIPMDDASFQAYTSIRGSLALSASELTPHRVQRFQRAVCVSWQAGRGRQHVFEQRAGGGGEHRLAGAAADAIAISRVAGAHPAESVLAFRPAVAVADFHRAREQPHRMGRARGGLSGLAKDQFVELSRVPFGGGKCAGRPGRQTQPVAIAPGQSLTLKGFNGSAASPARLKRSDQLC